MNSLACVRIFSEPADLAAREGREEVDVLLDEAAEEDESIVPGGFVTLFARGNLLAGMIEASIASRAFLVGLLFLATLVLPDVLGCCGVSGDDSSARLFRPTMRLVDERATFFCLGIFLLSFSVVVSCAHWDISVASSISMCISTSSSTALCGSRANVSSSWYSKLSPIASSSCESSVGVSISAGNPLSKPCMCHSFRTEQHRFGSIRDERCLLLSKTSFNACRYCCGWELYGSVAHIFL